MKNKPQTTSEAMDNFRDEFKKLLSPIVKWGNEHPDFVFVAGVLSVVYVLASCVMTVITAFGE